MKDRKDGKDWPTKSGDRKPEMTTTPNTTDGFNMTNGHTVGGYAAPGRSPRTPGLFVSPIRIPKSAFRIAPAIRILSRSSLPCFS